MGEQEIKPGPGSYESGAFMAALLLAAQGKDQEACDILREIANKMVKGYIQKGAAKRG